MNSQIISKTVAFRKPISKVFIRLKMKYPKSLPQTSARGSCRVFAVFGKISVKQKFDKSTFCQQWNPLLISTLHKTCKASGFRQNNPLNL